MSEVRYVPKARVYATCMSCHTDAVLCVLVSASAPPLGRFSPGGGKFLLCGNCQRALGAAIVQKCVLELAKEDFDAFREAWQKEPSPTDLRRHTKVTVTVDNMQYDLFPTPAEAEDVLGHLLGMGGASQGGTKGRPCAGCGGQKNAPLPPATRTPPDASRAPATPPLVPHDTHAPATPPRTPQTPPRRDGP